MSEQVNVGTNKPLPCSFETSDADERSCREILSDLVKIQAEIKRRIIEDEWQGMEELISIKARWEKRIGSFVKGIIESGDVQFFAALHDYVLSCREVVVVLEDNLKLTRNNIKKASIARKILANFGAFSDGNGAGKKSSGNFLDKAG